MSSAIAKKRLQEERKVWRRDHPIGFYARPLSSGDGSSNMFEWEAGVPGKSGTDWEGGVYKVKMKFLEDYPSRPPKCTYLLLCRDCNRMEDRPEHKRYNVIVRPNSLTFTHHCLLFVIHSPSFFSVIHSIQ